MGSHLTAVRTMLVGVTLLVGMPAGICRGSFVLIENFETLTPGPIDGQNGWEAAGLGGSVMSLGGGDNQMLQLTVDTGVLHKPMLVARGTRRMLFLRFAYMGQHNYSLGMSHLAWPTEYSDFGPELRKSGAQDELKIHDGATYVDLTTLQSQMWYNLWVLIDNDTGTSQVWLHARDRQDATAADQLDAGVQTAFDFRTDAGRDLIRFYLKAADGGSGNDPLWIDDIFLERTSAVNLTNPTADPLPGDADDDGDVDLDDFIILKSTFNQNPLTDDRADFDDDGDVDLDDFIILKTNFAR